MNEELETRIASVLDGKGSTADVAALVADAKAYAVELTAGIAQAEADSLDPRLTAADAEAAFMRGQKLAFQVKRLEATLKPALARLAVLRKADAEAAAKAEFLAARAERDILSADLTKFYPAAVERFLSLLKRIEASNNRLASANLRTPDGETWIRGAEEHARGPLSGAVPDFHLALRLPPWRQGSAYFPRQAGGL